MRAKHYRRSAAMQQAAPFGRERFATRRYNETTAARATSHKLTNQILPRTCIVASIALTACGPSPPQPAPSPPPSQSDAIVILLRPGPAAWFDATEDRGAGIDYELVQRFAQQHGLDVKIVPSANPMQRLNDVGSGAKIAGGGIYRSATGSPSTNAAPRLYSSTYHSVYPVLIYNIDGYHPESWKDLAGESVALLADSSLVPQLSTLREAHPEVDWQLLALPTTEALISQVSDGSLSYAIVASNEAEAVRNVYLSFGTGFQVGPKLDLVWAFPATQAQLRDLVDAFFANARRDGTMQRLIERYYTHVPVPRLDAGAFHDQIKSTLPQLRAHFERAQDATGVEWRLLAAIAYQESKWDALATSETGVRGLMQLTEETAKHLGGIDRLNPQDSVLAAARYLHDLKDRLPARIPEPDRTWLALAAYNIGIAHLEDARILAQKQKLSADTWSAVKKTLPLLALPEYYEDTKFGYARGGMPVAFVDRVRAYYGILLAQEPPLKPRLKMLSDIVDPAPTSPQSDPTVPGVK
ncbi:MAG: membrane-bound lytic murein transglycosylase MltF [Betaproteobacteria bacterium]|nr:MAG: membrane-bound lytic murein transglycosylase MltF [Betaproteobacteria bacterium]TMH07467.1 MAG: membrane-bound lytic murein transglycosylase MltF [Betaproteobacteria bacterium]